MAVHNTDDHLKNVGFLKDDGAETYRLSPLFDVVTQEGSARHYLHIGSAGRESSFANCLSEYRRFGLRSEAAAKAVLERVLDVVRDRQRYYQAAGMTPDEIAHVEASLMAWRQSGFQA
ncbi:hypothetical protein D3C72_1873150 [compost metagenome]